MDTEEMKIPSTGLLSRGNRALIPRDLQDEASKEGLIERWENTLQRLKG